MEYGCWFGRQQALMSDVHHGGASPASDDCDSLGPFQSECVMLLMCGTAACSACEYGKAGLCTRLLGPECANG